LKEKDLKGFKRFERLYIFLLLISGIGGSTTKFSISEKTVSIPKPINMKKNIK